jgi:hypothetical protein
VEWSEEGGHVVESIAIGNQVWNREGGGDWTTATMPQPVFAYAKTWQDAYATLTGWSIAERGPLEQRQAILLRNLHHDDETTKEVYEEELVWVDEASGRILQWNVNKYDGPDPADARLVAYWRTSMWEYDQDIEVEPPTEDG